VTIKLLARLLNIPDTPEKVEEVKIIFLSSTLTIKGGVSASSNTLKL
jgi:hypothetical protein